MPLPLILINIKFAPVVFYQLFINFYTEFISILPSIAHAIIFVLSLTRTFVSELSL